MMGASATCQYITKKELKGAIGERPDGRISKVA